MKTASKCPDCFSKFNGFLVWYLLQFVGNWFTQYTVPAVYQPRSDTCQRTQVGLNPDGTMSAYISWTSGIGRFMDICNSIRQGSKSFVKRGPYIAGTRFTVNMQSGKKQVLLFPG